MAPTDVDARDAGRDDGRAHRDSSARDHHESSAAPRRSASWIATSCGGVSLVEARQNKIKRLWLDMHAEVTRNHRCRTIEELMTEVHAFLRPRSKSDRVRYLQAAA